MQDVAIGTRSVKLSAGRRAIIPNAMRVVHKAEIIRLYTSTCDKGYTKKKGSPSERTLWNILNNCPASQRKSFASLDNVASEVSDGFDELISICKSLKNQELESLMKDLVAGCRYLRRDFRVTTASSMLCQIQHRNYTKKIVTTAVMKIPVISMRVFQMHSLK